MAFPDSDGFGGGSDSGGFGWIPSSPAVDYFAVFHRLHGQFDLESDVEDETSVNARRFE